MACTLDGMNQLTLMLCACSGNAFWDDLPLLRDKPLQAFLILVIDILFLGGTEPAHAFFARHLIVPFPSWSSLCRLIECHVFSFSTDDTKIEKLFERSSSNGVPQL